MTSVQFHAAALAVALVSLPIVAIAQDITAPGGTPPAGTAAVADPRAGEVSDPHGAAPFQLSLWDSVQVIDRSRSIHGLRLALPYGSNWDVHGVDIGFVNRTEHDFEGAQLSLAGFVDGHMKGLQYNWLVSSVGGEVQGVQFGVVNTAGSLEGAQFGAVNHASGGANGAAFGLVNVYEGASVGAELGIVNYASRIEGVQIGLVNVTDHLHGVQIGLVNVARNGFLPVFVIFNAAL
jgi:hypothetical protein